MADMNGWKCEWMFSRFSHSQDLLLPVSDTKPRPLQFKSVKQDRTPSLHLPLLHLKPPLVLLTFSGKRKIWGDYVTPLWRRILPISQAFILPLFFSPLHDVLEKMRGWRLESPAAPQSRVVFFSHLLLGGIGVPIRNWRPLLWLHTSEMWQPCKPK